MKKLQILAVASVFSLSALSAQANGTGPNPYSDCGIGAALFKNDTGATISNVIWDLGTTAITSATASPETCNGPEVEAAAFIHESYDALVLEVAKGSGDHLDALLSLLDVSDNEKSAVIAGVRAKMASTVSSSSYVTATRVEKSEELYFSLIAAVNA